MAEAPVTTDPIVITVYHPELGQCSWTPSVHTQRHLQELCTLVYEGDAEKMRGVS